jgi:MoaA/NifB/PqqE/SkfB family radical SAM enzyme
MEQGDMEPAIFSKTLEAFPHIAHMELQGEGEPLLHERFFEMAEMARQRNIAVSFITNGSLLSPHTVDGILSSGIDILHCSIDTADPGTFRKLRKGNLKGILHGIRLLMTKRNGKWGAENRRNIRGKGSGSVEGSQARPAVGLAITLLKSTMGGVEDLIRLYRDLGLDGGFIVQPLQKMDAYTVNYPQSLCKQVPSNADIARIEEELGKDGLFHEIMSQRSHFHSFYEKLYHRWNPEAQSCPWLSKGMYINFRGHALPCCKVKDTAFSYGIIGCDSARTMLGGRKELVRMQQRGEIPDCCRGCSTAERISAAIVPA